MAKSYATFKAILIAKLQALVDGNGTTIFSSVYGTNVTEPTGYPIAYVMEQEGSGKIVDTHRNERVWEFAVVLHYAVGDETEGDADAAILDAVDRVVTMFDQDPMLKDDSGFEQCMKVEVAPVHIERATQDVAVVRALLNVQVFDLVQRYASA